MDHWVLISDADLRFIEDGPVGASKSDADWIEEVIGIIEDGLETA